MKLALTLALPLALAACLVSDAQSQTMAGATDGAARADETPRVLFLTHSAGFVHSVVRRPEAGQLAHAEASFVRATEGRLRVTPTQDCADINAANLAQYDAVLFYTTGELPISEQGREELMDWIRAGGAFTGAHCATDTLYKYAPYVDLVGGLFDGHPWHKEVRVRVEDAAHPAVAHLAGGFTITDEIYQFRAFQRHPLRVLMTLDPESVQLGKGKRPDGDYALAWCKDFGEGRMFYTALGHREAVWEDERFLEHLMSGIEWAMEGPEYSPPAPAGGISLSADASGSAWRLLRGGEGGWDVADGVLEVTPGKGDLITKDELGSGLYHLEFQVPATPSSNRWQDRGNSGVYIQGRYEVQILDSHGVELKSGDCGGIYGKHAASVNACRKAGRWQAYDIRFRAPTFGPDGKKTANARMSVWHNGIRIHDDVEVDGTTTSAMTKEEGPTGPLLLQDHGHRVRYRNLWFAAND